MFEKLKKIITTLLSLLGLLSLVLFFILLYLGYNFASQFGVLEDESTIPDSMFNFGIVEIEGVLMSSKKIIKDMRSFAKNPRVQAIILRIDSPGGGVAPAQDIYDEIIKIKNEYKKPVIASYGNVAASAAYYLSSSCDKIVASPGSLTGSIGVIMHMPNLEELYKFIKVKPQVIKSGKFKDIGSGSRPLSEEEKNLLQDVIDTVHLQFQKAISESRNIKMQDVKKYADGRIFTGEQALSYGFVDSLGGLSKAVEIGVELTKIVKEPKLLYPRREAPLMEMLMQEMKLSYQNVIQNLFGHSNLINEGYKIQ